MKWVKKHTITFILVNLCTSLLSAQETKVDYQIILETKGEYNHIDQNSAVNHGNRMGLDEFSSISQLYPILGLANRWGELETKLQVEGNIRNYNFEKDSTGFSFQELYTQVSFKNKHYVVAGKKRLDWGTGMIWNPTNFFIQKDPLRTQNRLEGIFMLNYSYLFGQNGISFFLFPDKEKENFKGALKFDYSKERIDASLSFLEYGKYQQFGYDISYGGDLFTIHSEGVIKNFSKSYTIHEEGTVIPPEAKKKKFRSEWVAGATILFNARISFSTEYRFREEYLNKKEIDLYKKYLPENMILFDPLSIGKHTLFGNISYSETYGRWSVSLRTFYDPASGQLTVSPMGVLSLNNLKIELSGMFYNKALPLYNYQASLLISYFF